MTEDKGRKRRLKNLRPRKPKDGEKRSQKVSVYMTPSTKSKIESIVEDFDMSLGDLIEAIANNKARVVFEGEDAEEDLLLAA